MLQEFKQFAMRGNAVDLAVAVIIGAAFGAVVSSLVNDVIMPPIGKVIGGVDFTNLFLVLGHGDYASLKAAKEAGAATINYGLFVNTLINFLIVAFVLFVIVQAINRLRRQEPVPAPMPTEKPCPQCTLAIPIRATRCPHCTSTV